MNENEINGQKQLPQDKSKALLNTLKARFEKNMDRHKGIEWVKIQARLEAAPE
jgi:hypothetical protein